MTDIVELLTKHTGAVEQKISALDDDVKAAITAARTSEARLDELEQKSALGGYSEPYGGKSWGDQVTQSDDLNRLIAIKSTAPGRVRIEVKDITSLTSPVGGAARDPNWNMLAGRQPRLRDILTVLKTSSGSVDYVHQKTRENNAAVQVEGELKAESSFAWELKNEPIRTIAHWTKASVQILDDIPQLRSMIDNELVYGVALAEEEEILTGSGVSPHLNGLITNATAYVAPFTMASATPIDQIGLGLLQVANAYYVPNGVVMNPADWLRIRLLKDGEGNYLLGNPQSAVEQTLFGVKVVTSTAIEIDKFLIGDFARAATLYDRQETRVDISTEDSDNFVRNMVTLRGENRVALAIKNPTALVYGDFGLVA